MSAPAGSNSGPPGGPNDRNGTNKPSDRIGRALIKYLKPIRTVLPHYFPWQSAGKNSGNSYAGDSNASSTSASGNQKYDEFSALVASADKFQDSERAKKEADEALPLSSASAAPPKHWLELVLFLLQACKRVSTKLAAKSGVIAYQTMHIAKGRQNIQSKGSIIDTTPLAISEDDDEAASGIKKAG